MSVDSSLGDLPKHKKKRYRKLADGSFVSDGEYDPADFKEKPKRFTELPDGLYVSQDESEGEEPQRQYSARLSGRSDPQSARRTGANILDSKKDYYFKVSTTVAI